MDAVATFNAVRKRFHTEVAKPRDLRVFHDNQPTETVASGCHLQIDVDGPGQMVAAAGPGGSRWRTSCRAMVTLWVPAANGDDEALLELGNAIKAAFRGVILTDPFVYFEMEPEFVGRAVREGAHCQRLMSIPFEAEEIA